MVDRADLLSPAAERRLTQTLRDYEAKHGHQIVVHTTPSLEDLPIADYSIRIAEAWRVGHKGLDNGVILTVAPTERKLRIEVGYGLEGVFPDAIAKRIIEDVMLPEIRAGGMESGIELGVAHVMATASGEPAPPRPRSRGRRRSSGPSPLVYLLLLLPIFGGGRRTRGLFFLPFLGGMGRGGNRMGGGGFGGGFGGGGGGFGGGGGGFGGGGASGSW